MWPLIAAAGLLLGAGFVVASDPWNGAEAVVEDFFEAIVDKDVDRALSYVGRIGTGVPYGEAAAFIHPDAIADGWELLSVEGEVAGQYATDTWVGVTIGNEHDSVTGQVEVTEFGDEWNVVDPFVTVAIEATPFTYVQLNDRTVVMADLHAANVAGIRQNQYKVLPGLYEFFPDMPGTTTSPETGELLPPQEDADRYGHEITLAPPTLTFSDGSHQAAQEAVNEIVDDCVAFEVRMPPYCPFGIDSYHEDSDGYITDIHDITWSVEQYPTVELADPGPGDDRDMGLLLNVVDPGRIALSASGEDDDPIDFTAECEVATDPIRAALRPDGTVEVYQLRNQGGFLAQPYETDTCEVTDITPAK